MRAMPWPSSSFGTRARPSEFAAGLPHARSSRRGRASRTKELTIQTAHLVPAAHFCVRGLHPCFTHPERGVGGAPRNVRVLGGTPVGRIMTRYARRLRGALRPMTRDARLSALHRGDFGLPGPRFRLLRRPPSYNGGQVPCGSVQRAPRSQVVVPGGRLPGPPGANGYEPPPQDATPRSAFRMSPETPLDERGWEAM